MANLQIPPQPIDDNDPTSVAWSDWYTKVRFAMNTSGIDWTTITNIPANLTGLASVSFAADEGIYATGAHTFGTFSLPSFSRGVLAATTAALFKSNISAGDDVINLTTKNASYTTVLADKGTALLHTDASAYTWTIDSNANVAYALGTVLSFINDGTGTITIAIAGTDTLVNQAGSTGSRTLAQYGRATAIKIGTTRWQIHGVNLT